MAKYPVSPAEVPGSVPEGDRDVIATPQGDNEFDPGQPLPAGSEAPAPERPRGNEPHPQQPIRPAEGV